MLWPPSQTLLQHRPVSSNIHAKTWGHVEVIFLKKRQGTQKNKCIPDNSTVCLLLLRPHAFGQLMTIASEQLKARRNHQLACLPALVPCLSIDILTLAGTQTEGFPGSNGSLSCLRCAPMPFGSSNPFATGIVGQLVRRSSIAAARARTATAMAATAQVSRIW